MNFGLGEDEISVRSAFCLYSNETEDPNKFRIGANFITLHPQDRAKLAASIQQAQQDEPN